MPTTTLSNRPKRSHSEIERANADIQAAKITLSNILDTRKISPNSKDFYERTLKQCDEALERKERDEVFDGLKEQILYQEKFLTGKLERDEALHKKREDIQHLLQTV